MADFLKGQIAEMAQINSETLRFYEKCSLIPAPKRTKSGYRLYPGTVLHRLEFIKYAKASGFTLKEIKEMFNISENQNIGIEELNRIVNEKINDIDKKISGLNEMKSMLTDFKNGGRRSIECPHINAFLKNFNE